MNIESRLVVRAVIIIITFIILAWINICIVTATHLVLVKLFNTTRTLIMSQLFEINTTLPIINIVLLRAEQRYYHDVYFGPSVFN